MTRAPLLDAPLDAPLDTDVFAEPLTVPALAQNPYRFYTQLRAKAPVCRAPQLNRTLVTKAAHTQAIKDNPTLFSSDDPHTPMERAFQAKTLMRRDGADHKRLRDAMMPSFAPRHIKNVWTPRYRAVCEDYVSRLPRGEIVDLFPALAGPVSARCLAIIMGMEPASDAEMMRWSQTLIDGAGNFAGVPELFERTETANTEMNALFETLRRNVLDKRDPEAADALSVQLLADDPIEWDMIIANIKIAIGGGINEPRDSMLTAIYGLLSNPEQLDVVKAEGGRRWVDAFEEAIRWVAPIQISSRKVTADTEIGGVALPKGEVIMTCQASANWDEDIWEDGEVYNALRPKKPHQAFGNGPHFCMGTHIARRMVAEIMLPLLFERFPNMELAEGTEWFGFGFRGPIKLPVRLG